MAIFPVAAPTSTLSGVVFDLDGVIIDSHAAHRKAWGQFLQSLGLGVSEADLNFILDGRKRSDILRHFLGDLSDDELAGYGRKKDHLFQQIQADVDPVPGIVSLLHDLRQCEIPVALASSASRNRAHSTLERLNIAKYFRFVVTAEDVAMSKPDPAIYALAAQGLNESPGSLLAIEDAVSGIQSATAAGLRCLAVATHQARENLLAAGACDTVTDFKGISARELMRIHRKQSDE